MGSSEKNLCDYRLWPNRVVRMRGIRSFRPPEERISGQPKPKHDRLATMNAELLNHSELSEVLDMIHALTSCRDMDNFIPIASRLEGLTGCEHLIFGIPERLGTGETVLADVNISYPQEWVDFYQAREFWRTDPVVLYSFEKSGPQCWADIYRHYPPDKEFMELAHTFLGGKDGYTCLCRPTTGGEWTLVSLAGDFTRQNSRVDYILDRVTPHLHLALLAIKKRDLAQTIIVKTTHREKEVLQWLKQGKTSWEISVILNVSEATINFHVKNIKKKLNAVSRSQAVATAIQYGVIGP